MGLFQKAKQADPVANLDAKLLAVDELDARTGAEQQAVRDRLAGYEVELTAIRTEIVIGKGRTEDHAVAIRQKRDDDERELTRLTKVRADAMKERGALLALRAPIERESRRQEKRRALVEYQQTVKDATPHLLALANLNARLRELWATVNAAGMPGPLPGLYNPPDGVRTNEQVSRWLQAAETFPWEAEIAALAEARPAFKPTGGAKARIRVERRSLVPLPRKFERGDVAKLGGSDAASLVQEGRAEFMDFDHYGDVRSVARNSTLIRVRMLQAVEMPAVLPTELRPGQIIEVAEDTARTLVASELATQV